MRLRAFSWLAKPPAEDSRSRRVACVLALCASMLAACRSPGYSASDPTEITCGCHDGSTCYDGASSLASSAGETAETGEQLLYFAQCACFQGSMAGCNTLSHFAKDYVAACERNENVRDTCAIAGFVHHHAVRVPRLHGRSFPRDPAAARAAFDKACRAGADVACNHVSR